MPVTKKGTNGTKNRIKDVLVEQVTIPAPNMEIAEFRIIGDAPYVQNAFPQKAMEEIRATQVAGSTAKKGKKREPKDFDAMYEQSLHRSEDGWFGIPAPAFRNAMIDACRLVGFHMTKAKMSVFCLADGYDPRDHSPLVRITKGEPNKIESLVRLQGSTPDIHARGLWEPGWEAIVRIQYDADQFTRKDVANLLVRVGGQVGVGEGRPFSPNSAGMGWGTFVLASDEA